MKSLINLSEHDSGAFKGGLSFKSSIIVLLSRESKTYLFLYRDGKIKGLTDVNSIGFAQVEIKYQSSNAVIFLVRAHATYERGDNPLFIFNGEQLFRIREYPELYDAEVNSSGRRIAYCYWEKDKRHIVVKELNLSKKGDVALSALKQIMSHSTTEPLTVVSAHALQHQ